MADFNKVLTPGDVDAGIVNVVVEIPQGSYHKIEWDRDLAVMKLDRVEPAIFAKPTNYGLIGVLEFVDDDEVDDKVIVVPADDRNTGDAINSLEDLPAATLKQIEHHFNHYKDLKKPGTTVVKGFGDAARAKQIIHESIARWNER